MPYFAWKGIDLRGNLRSGFLRACSIKELEHELIHRDIGFISARKKRILFSSIRHSDKVSFFYQLGSLLKAGVRLNAVLKIITAKTRSYAFANILEDIWMQVEQGILFHDALGKYLHVFEPLMIQMVRVGQDGDARGAYDLLCAYLQERQALKNKMRSAAMMPLITLVFFLTIFLGILLFIIPRFADMFASLDIELPVFTSILLQVSNFLQNISFFYVLGFASIVVIAARAIVKTRWGKKVWDKGVIKSPYVGSLMKQQDLCMFFKSFALLLNAGVSLVRSLELSLFVIQNDQICKQMKSCLEDIRGGMSLSLSSEKVTFIDEEILALIVVGERSGKLGSLIAEAGNLCHERMIAKAGFLTHILQPLLLVFLAFSIVGLMLAVYAPILTLSESIG